MPQRSLLFAVRLISSCQSVLSALLFVLLDLRECVCEKTKKEEKCDGGTDLAADLSF